MRADARKNYDQLLVVARAVVAEQGADASLRDIARRADVGLATLYRHFPTREALLEVLLRTGFDTLAAQAEELETSDSPQQALSWWLGHCVARAHEYRGVTTLMMAAIDDTDSALHASCVAMRAAGARQLNLLLQNQIGKTQSVLIEQDGLSGHTKQFAMVRFSVADSPGKIIQCKPTGIGLDCLTV